MKSPQERTIANRETGPASDRPRRHARELTEAVVENMRQNLEELRFCTLAPTRYIVYLHPGEFDRLEAILPTVRQETVRALIEELQKLNRPPVLARLTRGLVSPAQPPVEMAAGAWDVEFVADANGDLAAGDLVVESELRMKPLPDLGVGERTRRVTTRLSSIGTVTESRLTERPTEPVRVLARVSYEDNDGPHTFEMVSHSITIGRGRNAEPVDVTIASSADVSRVHARIRYDPPTGQFFLSDLSSLGTTLNRRHVPSGFDDADGGKRENGKETPLPNQARIGLAEMVYLDFEILR